MLSKCIKFTILKKGIIYSRPIYKKNLKICTCMKNEKLILVILYEKVKFTDRLVPYKLPKIYVYCIGIDLQMFSVYH